MLKIKCHICKGKNRDTVCERCGASLGTPTEKLLLSTGGYTILNDDGKNVDSFSSCKVSFTNKRLVIYKIRPQAENPAFGLFKDFRNAIAKNPYISIKLNDINWVRRYDSKYYIDTKTGVYWVWLNKPKEVAKLFAPYAQAG